MNTKTTPHMPGPYTVEKNVIAGGRMHLAITNRDNGKEWMLCSITPMEWARPVDYANAQFICCAITHYDQMLNILRDVVNHADKRQAVATAGTEDPELNRLEEPEFVQYARELLSAVKISLQLNS